MKTRQILALLGCALLYACASAPQSEGGLAGVIAPGAEVRLVKEGYLFTEGPLGTADGGLLFTDLRTANRIYRLDPVGRITVVLENSNTANGLAFTQGGDLLAAEGGGKRISRVAPDGRVAEVTRGDGERPLMSPNDLIVDAKGGIYFTDPGPRPVVPGRKAYVYYLPPGASKALVQDDAIIRPNGLTITLDGKMLIVADTVGDTLYAFDIAADGSLANRRAFARIQDLPEGKESGADGMAIDREGRLFVTTLTGVQVFSGGGDYLGTIRVPRQPSNVAFSGTDNRTLYITAREGLYQVPTLTQGPDRRGK